MRAPGPGRGREPAPLPQAVRTHPRGHRVRQGGRGQGAHRAQGRRRKPGGLSRDDAARALPQVRAGGDRAHAAEEGGQAAPRGRRGQFPVYLPEVSFF